MYVLHVCMLRICMCMYACVVYVCVACVYVACVYVCACANWCVLLQKERDLEQDLRTTADYPRVRLFASFFLDRERQ